MTWTQSRLGVPVLQNNVTPLPHKQQDSGTQLEHPTIPQYPKEGKRTPTKAPPISPQQHSSPVGRTNVSREGWFEAWLALLALNGFNQRCLLPTDVGPSASHHKHIEVVA